MSTTEIREAALKLSETERARLAEELLASLDGPDQGAIDSIWATEAEKRIDAIEAGAKTVAAEQVLREIENRRR
jgi:putative addiction module component (TIGR02574 family)